jgi:hypothetical protein
MNNEYLYKKFNINNSFREYQLFHIKYKQYILFLIIIIISIYNNNKKYNNTLNKVIFLNEKYSNISGRFNEHQLDYNNTFVIIKDNKCKICGLMAYYKHYLVCITKYLNLGYIPIIDLISFPNIFNRYNISSIESNPWEIFFTQPFGYTLENVLKNGKNIKYSICKFRRKMLTYYIFNNTYIIYYWHTIAINYIPINKQIIIEANFIIHNLFNGSKNILGILIRGTDYLARKPSKHPITPNPEMVVEDIKYMNKNNKYDYYFIATEDDLIRKKFFKIFRKKLKYIKQKSIKYNYKSKKFLSYNKNIKGNINNMKIYLFNIIILSKCIDIISARTSGSIGVFILSNGFRNAKIYFLGEYK